ncbi:MAG: hypothetical protein ACI4QT_08925, partial [Kiritimatiellia bacterium]
TLRRDGDIAPYRPCRPGARAPRHCLQGVAPVPGAFIPKNRDKGAFDNYPRSIPHPSPSAVATRHSGLPPPWRLAAGVAFVVNLRII